MSLKDQTGSQIQEGSCRSAAAYAPTGDPCAPLKAELTDKHQSVEEFSTSVDRQVNGGRIQVSLDRDEGATVYAESTIGPSKAITQDGKTKAGAVGERTFAQSNKDGRAVSKAWGWNSAQAVAMGQKSEAMIATASGSMAQASGTNAYCVTWGPNDGLKPVETQKPGILTRFYHYIAPSIPSWKNQPVAQPDDSRNISPPAVDEQNSTSKGKPTSHKL